MSEQYFKADPHSAHKPKVFHLEYHGNYFSFETDAGVFSRDALDEGTRLLLDAVTPLISGKVLDLGCGWGAVGIILSKLHPDCVITMIDINQRACGLAERNAGLNGVSPRVLCDDGLEITGESYDWILLNPPIRAGKQTVYGLYRRSAASLNPGGCLSVVIRKQQGASSSKTELESLFHTVILEQRRKGYCVFICREARE